MIDNLNGLARLFASTTRNAYSQAHILPVLADRLVKADMGAAAAQQYMPEWYHKTVAEARKWLRDQAALDGSRGLVSALNSVEGFPMWR